MRHFDRLARMETSRFPLEGGERLMASSRKYAVPLIMCLLAVTVISMESAVYMIALLVGTEMVLIFNRRRGIRNV